MYYLLTYYVHTSTFGKRRTKRRWFLSTRIVVGLQQHVPTHSFLLYSLGISKIDPSLDRRVLVVSNTCHQSPVMCIRVFRLLLPSILSSFVVGTWTEDKSCFLPFIIVYGRRGRNAEQKPVMPCYSYVAEKDFASLPCQPVTRTFRVLWKVLRRVLPLDDLSLLCKGGLARET